MTGDNVDDSTAPQTYTQADADTVSAAARVRRREARASRLAAQELKSSPGRRIDIPVRKSFVRPTMTAADPKSPLSKIYGGGRSGVVAVKLYLALLWRCSAPPFSTSKPARAWATLLNLEDPDGNGARRIKDAMKTLAKADLIEITEKPGFPNTITLLDESGDGAAYQLPSTAYTFAKKNKATTEALARDVYFKVPSKLWVGRGGYMQKLSGPGVIMLLILLAERAGEGEEVWFSTTEFPARYSISHKTRAAGTKELEELGLLDVGTRSLAASPYSTTFDTRRRRKVYELTPAARVAGKDKVAEAQVVATPGRRLRRKPSPSMSTAQR